MKAKFDLMQYMRDNREVVISKYEKLQNEEFFDNVSLKTFMVEVLNLMRINDPRSEKRANTLLPNLMGRVYVDHASLHSVDVATDRLRAKYQGKAEMAMI